jgi:transposase
MKEIINLLDKNLRYKSHEIQDGIIIISVKSKRKKIECPYCGAESKKTHSQNIRKFQDLPITGKKVTIVLERRKYICKNPECSYKTFAERFDFYDSMSRKTKRLSEEILRVSLTQSSVSASKYLRRGVVDVGKSTICNMLKKRNDIDGSE